MPNLGPTEVLIVLGVIVFLFGARKLPEFARSLGKAKKEFREGMEEGAEETEPEPESKPEAN